MGYAFIQKNISTGMRDSLYTSVLRKDLGWHDQKENSSGVISTMLNAQINQMSTVVIETSASNLEGFAALLVGLVFAFIFSWPIVVAIFLVAPLMLISSKVGHTVKQKQWGIQKGEQKEQKEGDILLSDSIVNFKTVASIANHEILVDRFDEINTRRA